MPETNDTITITKQKIAFYVAFVSPYGWPLRDQQGNVWRDGKNIGKPMFGLSENWCRSAESEAWIDIPNADVWEIVSSDTRVSRVNVRYADGKYHEFDLVDLDEADAVRQQFREGAHRVVYVTFEGATKSIDMTEVQCFEVGAPRKVIDR